MSETPSNSNSNRRLAAILFADLAGYTRLMQTDEQQAALSLKKFQNEVRTKVPAEGGRIVNFYGDGVLCVFNTPVEAVLCAISLQNGFVEASIPVRIGLHSGIVTFDGDQVYGDSVNLASRIESMGVPGSILLSDRIRRDIKNQPQIEVKDMGLFKFKNVEDPMAVHAVSGERLTIPNRGDIGGKASRYEPSRSRSLKLALPLILILILAGLFWWSKSVKNIFPSGEPAFTTPLSQNARDKRVAVMVFENKTGTNDLEDFGSMISDWVTRGLMETEEANVISAANIQTQIAQAGFGSGANPELAAASGVDIMLQGRYYLQESQLIIHSNIVELRTGEVIHALEPITGPRQEMLSLLETLTEEVLGYWAVKRSTRFHANPPKYEAYKEYLAGEKLSQIDFEQSEMHLIKSYQADTTFLAPLFKLIPLYNNVRQFEKADSIIDYIAQNDFELTKWESLRISALKARQNFDYLKSAQLNEEMYRMDPSDDIAMYNAGSRYLQANYPEKAIEILTSFDSRYGLITGRNCWEENRLAQAYIRLDRYEEALKTVEECDADRIYDQLASTHLWALVLLDSLEKMDRMLNYYLQQDIYRQAGTQRSNVFLFFAICNVLELTGKEEAFTKYAQQLYDWVIENFEEPESEFSFIFANFWLGRYEDVIQLIQGLDQINVGPGGLIFRAGMLGVCYARLNQQDKAREAIEMISSLDWSEHHGLKEYRIAAIKTAQGKHSEAISLLKTAEEKGVPPVPGRYNEDALFKDLLYNPEFISFTAPRTL